MYAIIKQCYENNIKRQNKEIKKKHPQGKHKNNKIHIWHLHIFKRKMEFDMPIINHQQPFQVSYLQFQNK